jgi:hypothetical protein
MRWGTHPALRRRATTMIYGLAALVLFLTMLGLAVGIPLVIAERASGFADDSWGMPHPTG